MSKNYDKHKISALSDECNDTLFNSWSHLSDKMIKVQETVSEAMELNDFNLNDKCLAASKLVGNFIAIEEGLHQRRLNREVDILRNVSGYARY